VGAGIASGLDAFGAFRSAGALLVADDVVDDVV